jgi:hypothetical protein
MRAVPCIDLSSPAVGAHPQRIMVPVSSMSACAQEAVTRAKLAAERRFAGNETLELTGAPLDLNKRELLASLLDVRTKHCRHLTKAQSEAAFDLCLDQLCAFTERCEDFDAAAAAAAAGPPAPRQPAPGPLDSIATALGVAGKFFDVPPLPQLGFPGPVRVPQVEVAVAAVVLALLASRGVDGLRLALAALAAACFLLFKNKDQLPRQRQ